MIKTDSSAGTSARRSARVAILASPFLLLKSAPKEASAAWTSMSVDGITKFDSAARMSAKEGAGLAAMVTVVVRNEGEERRKFKQTECAVTTANSKDKDPQVEPAQALSEECSETETGLSGEEGSSKSTANDGEYTDGMCGPNSQQQGQDSTSGYCSSSV